jgi:D-glycero-alpha-D-manno-heptose-7-phosphate kinase
MIISRTPVRISFFGGGTDYPAWYTQHGGAVLSTTIDKYAYLSCRYLPPFFEHRSRIVYSKIELVQNRQEIEHPAVRETLRYLAFDDGIEVHYDGDIPARTGVGSSSAFTVGLLHSVYAMQGKMPTRQQLAQDAIYVEQTLMADNVGAQDQVAAAFGGFNVIRFHTSGQFDVRPVITSPQRLAAFQSHLMLVFTGFQRNATDIAAAQVKATPSKGAELRLMQHMVDEALSILCSDRDLAEFGQLLHEGWQLKRSLTSAVSTPAIDEIYAAAREAGAIGGKLLGAGGGGFALLFVRPEQRASVAARLRSLSQVPFNFDTSGSQIIVYQPDEHVLQPVPANPVSAVQARLPHAA